MSFEIKLQQNSSPANYVSKTVVDVLSLTGNLKEETSILDPVVVVESSASASVITGVNYAYISTFGRYYYITDIVSIATNLWEISLHVDVLMSYGSQIRSQDAVVARQRDKRNMYLDDGWFMAYQDPIIVTKTFSAATPFETQSYVLAIAGS